jgi:sugar phosphate isomerase/epimerase
MGYGLTDPTSPTTRAFVRTDQLALQLYTVRESLEADLPATLGRVADSGVDAVELAGLPPIDAEALRDALAKAGLRPIASHESLERIQANPDAVIERLHTLGIRRAVIPWLRPELRSTPEVARRTAQELRRLAQYFDVRGMRLGYHNHDFEFAPLDGTTLWDVLMEELPAGVELELDLYWASIAGQDPVELIKTCGSRVRMLHLKDMAATPAREDLVPGDGVLDWTGIVTLATELGIDWYIIEQDNARNPFVDIARARNFLLGLVDRY